MQDALRLWQERAERLRAIRQSLDEAAEAAAPIRAEEMRAHFEIRFADLYTKQV